MATFILHSVNHVTGVCAEEDYAPICSWISEGRQGPKPGTVFSFCPDDEYGDPISRQYLTGDYTFMDKLLEGHDVVFAAIPVPFSDGLFRPAEGNDRTTAEEVLLAFGLLTPREVPDSQDGAIAPVLTLAH